MSDQDDFFTPEELDRQIEQVSLHRAGEQADAEMLAYLRSFYAQDGQQEQKTLDRIWGRVAAAAPPFPAHLQHTVQQKQDRREKSMYNQPTLLSNQPGGRKGRTLWQRLGMLAAVVVVVALVGSTAAVFYILHQSNGGPATGGPRPPVVATAHPTVIPTTGLAPFRVTSVDMAVAPTSIAGIPCGTQVTVTYKATIHVLSHGPGGVVQFGYTVNNGRGQTPASVTFAAGETSKTYSFTWSGALPIDHTYPGQGGISVSSPNQLASSLVGPSGTCVVQAAFVVTGVDMAVSPTSIQGIACGTSIVVTYTATIHVAANSPGGTVQFSYTLNNGRSQTPASVTFAPGQTSKTYSFTWSGALPMDHTYPGPGGISVTSPNQLISPLLGPSGTCK